MRNIGVLLLLKFRLYPNPESHVGSLRSEIKTFLVYFPMDKISKKVKVELKSEHIEN